MTPTSCLQDVYGAGKDNGGRGTDSLGGRYPNRTNGAPTPTIPKVFTGQMPFLPPNQFLQLNNPKYTVKLKLAYSGVISATSVVWYRDVKSREFFFSIREIFSRDSKRILDHVMMMSSPAE